MLRRALHVSLLCDEYNKKLWPWTSPKLTCLRTSEIISGWSHSKMSSNILCAFLHHHTHDYNCTHAYRACDNGIIHTCTLAYTVLGHKVCSMQHWTNTRLRRWGACTTYKHYDAEEGECNARVATIYDRCWSTSFRSYSPSISSEAEADKPHEAPETIDNPIHHDQHLLYLKICRHTHCITNIFVPGTCMCADFNVSV